MDNTTKALFEALKRYVDEECGGRHAAAGTKLGIPRWQMTRWFSKSDSYGGWSKPRIHILMKLAFADVHPISTIARTLLENEGLPIDSLARKRRKPIEIAKVLYERKMREADKLVGEASALLDYVHGGPRDQPCEPPHATGFPAGSTVGGA